MTDFTILLKKFNASCSCLSEGNKPTPEDWAERHKKSHTGYFVVVTIDNNDRVKVNPRVKHSIGWSARVNGDKLLIKTPEYTEHVAELSQGLTVPNIGTVLEVWIPQKNPPSVNIVRTKG